MEFFGTQKKIENKPFGILGDGGFTFDLKDEEIPILSVKPAKCPNNTASSPLQVLNLKMLLKCLLA
jgi:hypothetical protein